jgi:hypothetical protein
VLLLVLILAAFVAFLGWPVFLLRESYEPIRDVRAPVVGSVLPGIRRLESAPAAERARAIERFGDAVLGEDGKERFGAAVPVLLRYLAEEDAEVRFYAAWALLCLERTALPAVEGLAERAASDDDPEVRRIAVEALARIAPPPRAFAEAMFGAESLEPAPADPDPQRTAEASAVGLAAVATALSDTETLVRKAALGSVDRWGHDAAPLAVQVAPFLRDPDPGTRYVAAGTARRIDAPPELVLDGLIAILEEPLPRSLPAKDARPLTKRIALRWIRTMGLDARRAIPAVKRLEDDSHVSEDARETLAALVRAVK